MTKKILYLLFSLFLLSCSNKEEIYEPISKKDPYKVYREAYTAFEKGDYFFAEKKFSEAELNFENVDFSAKSAIMAAYCLYGINFFDEALESVNTFLKKYPADKNVVYAHYLIAIIYFEQISDEKKDLEPLLKAKEKINFFLQEYPNNDYSIDLKFKKDLIINQLASKELYIAKYYTKIKKQIPAINRLKIIVAEYDQTIFIEEALHRLVEIYYHIGLENEAKKYAKILGYNYNSSEWFEQSYKIFNQDYNPASMAKADKKQDDGILKKIFKKIR